MATNAAAAPQPTASQKHFNLAARPTTPTIMIPFKGQLYALPLLKLDIQAEFNVSTAFVKVVGTWRNIASYTADCIFTLPLTGTVTEVNIKIQQDVNVADNDKFLMTAIIPKEMAEEMCPPGEDDAKETDSLVTNPDGTTSQGPPDPEQGKLPDMSFDEYIPNLFRLPINQVFKGDIVTVTAVYIEPLTFVEGKYQFSLPLKFSKNLLPKVRGPNGPEDIRYKNVNDVLSLKCVINSVTPDAHAESNSHKLQIQEAEAKGGTNSAARAKGTEHSMIIRVTDFTPTAAELEADDKLGSKDFNLSYSITSSEVLPTFIDEPIVGADGGAEGNFLLFVTPPSIGTSECPFTRKMFFLLDRSGSMTGEPYGEATKALVRGLQILKHTDMFSIICFDHTMVQYPPGGGVVYASAENIELAAKWALMIVPQSGGTDIRTPMKVALDTLAAEEKKDESCLPFVCLITDGCVEFEREICRDAAAHHSKARVLTFGIGSYCNWYFLKMLSQICRGFSDVVVYKERINQQILQLLNMAAHPVLTNVQLAITNVQDVQLYPFPVPDLFKGAPLTITGKYRGKLPSTVGLQGMEADGTIVRKYIKVRTSDVIPVSKVFIKQRIDLLSAKAWMEESDEIKEEVVDLSCSETMPSPYTMMISFEADEETKRLMEEQEEKDGEDDALLGDSKGNGMTAKKKKKKWYKNKKTLALIAAGNVAVVGAIAFSFGDLAASAGNLPVIGSFFGEIGGLDIGDMGCCGDCCGDCADCISSCEISDCLVC